MRIYVGNLSFDTTPDQLQKVFEQYGDVTGVTVPEDRFTGKPRGFGFVEMASDDAATSAINALDAKALDGRTLTVSEARPRNDGGTGRSAQQRW
jgi:RNA recognition motif-containing protein